MARSAIVRIDRYTRGAIWLHWIIAALVLVNLTIGLLHESLLGGVKGAIPLHISIGLSVLALTLARIAWRFAHRPPRLPAVVPRWERAAARVGHFGFYALLLALPLSGWAMGSAGPRARFPTRWFTPFDVPHLPVSASGADLANRGHGVLGYLTLALVVLHVAAALRHHFVLRDGVLARMAPVLERRRRRQL